MLDLATHVGLRVEDAEIGERVLATSFVHLDVPTPYRSSGPIFVRETAQTADLGVGEVPRMFNDRLLSLRAYDSEGMMTTAKVVPGTELAQAIVEQFMDDNVEFQQIHNASVGCFDCTVRRA